MWLRPVSWERLCTGRQEFDCAFWRLMVNESSIRPQEATDTDLRQRLESDLKRAYGDASIHLQRIEVRIVYKDVTIEMLYGDDFREAAEKSKLNLKGMYEEYEAARTRAYRQE